jgi:hypothetical protein
MLFHYQQLLAMHRRQARMALAIVMDCSSLVTA